MKIEQERMRIARFSGFGGSTHLPKEHTSLRTSLPTCGQTDTCQNITLPQTAGGNNFELICGITS